MGNTAFMCKNRHGTYYARFIIPKQLQPHFKNKREIRKSLRTDSRKLAVKMARAYRVQFESVIDDLMSKTDNTSERAKRIIDSMFVDKAKLQEQATEQFVKGMMAGMAQPSDSAGKIRLMLITHVDAFGNKTVIDHGDPDEERKTLDVFLSKQSTPTQIAPATGKTISEYLDEYIAHKMTPGKKGSWSSGTARQKPQKLSTFRSVFGERIAASLTRDDTERYIKLAYAIPANFNNPDHVKNKFQGITLDMILNNSPELEAVDYEVRGVGTIRDDLATVRAFLRWVLERKDINLQAPINALNNEVSDIQYESERRPFTSEELRTLFEKDNPAPENYVKGFSKPISFFLPLIALYTGARLAEICQLHLNDIKRVESSSTGDFYWVIDINEDDDKKLKNKHSRRQIPLHKALVEAGLLEYVERMRSAGETRLFPGVVRTSSQFGSQSQWFGNYSDEAGVTDKQTSFHSFRHCFCSYLSEHHTPEDLLIALSGHQYKSLAKSTYDRSRKRDIGKLAEVIDSIDFGLKHPCFKYMRL